MAERPGLTGTYTTGALRVEDPRTVVLPGVCSACGQVNASLTLADRIWTCGCGAVHDRDENSGTNLARLPASWAEAPSDGKTVSVRRVALKRVKHPGRVAA